METNEYIDAINEGVRELHSRMKRMWSNTRLADPNETLKNELLPQDILGWRVSFVDHPANDTYIIRRVLFNWDKEDEDDPAYPYISLILLGLGFSKDMAEVALLGLLHQDLGCGTTPLRRDGVLMGKDEAAQAELVLASELNDLRRTKTKGAPKTGNYHRRNHMKWSSPSKKHKQTGAN